MRLSGLGIRFLVFSLFLLVFSFIFSDYFILSLLLLILSLFFIDALVLSFSKVEVEPKELRFSMTAGERIEADFKVEKPRFLKFEAKSNLLKVREKIIFNPKVFGIYRSSVFLELRFLGLFLKDIEAIKIEAKVYPRFFREFLIALGMVGEGKPSKETGIGLEYFGSREYVPGDDLRAIDWKATARMQKLIVKEFHRETGKGAFLVYDLRSPGEVSADEIAKAFLSSLLSFDSPVSVLIHNGKEVLYHAEKLEVFDALKVAIRFVFERFFATPEAFEIFEPKTRREILSLLRSVGKEVILRKEKPIDLIKRSDADVLIFAFPGYDTSDLLSILEELRFSGRRVQFFIPKSPWLDSRSLEEAYIDYISYQKIVKALRKVCEVKTI